MENQDPNSPINEEEDPSREKPSFNESDADLSFAAFDLPSSEFDPAKEPLVEKIAKSPLKEDEEETIAELPVDKETRNAPLNNEGGDSSKEELIPQNQKESSEMLRDDELPFNKEIAAQNSNEPLEEDLSAEETKLNDEGGDSSKEELISQNQKESSDTLRDDGLPFNEEIAAQNSDEPLEESFSNEEAKLEEEKPQEASSFTIPNEEEEKLPSRNTLFEESPDAIGPLAEIDFGLIETGRWLLKIVGGPNNGAEFYMDAGKEYILGTDPKSCEIVLYDTTVSRQHARLIVTEEETLFIEDLGSKNGVLLNGVRIDKKEQFAPGVMVVLGTTSFVVYDREGEMQTIISPILPSLVKSLQKESEESLAAQNKEVAESVTKEEEKLSSENKTESTNEAPKIELSRGSYVLLTIAFSFLALLGFGIYTLFHEEPIPVQTQENANELIQNALKPFPSVRWTYNKGNASLLLLGHVLTNAERNQVLYNLDALKFIKNIDSNGLIIDEGVWNEINSLLSNNSAWRGITVHSNVAGQFTISGELQTRKQAEQLSAYLSRNFPYVDLLKKDIVVEEDIVNRIMGWLREAQLVDITAKMTNGEVLLSGTEAPDQTGALDSVVAKIKQINGVRIVVNTVQVHTTESGTTDISDHYAVGGKSRVGNRFTVVINGRILSEGDELDGMTITKINAHRILLEKDNDKFRIDY